jgi:hypothetical protein
VWGGGGGGGGALISAPLLAQAMRYQVDPGCTAFNHVLFINPVSLSFSSTFLCIAVAGQQSIKMLTPWVRDTNVPVFLYDTLT